MYGVLLVCPLEQSEDKYYVRPDALVGVLQGRALIDKPIMVSFADRGLDNSIIEDLVKYGVAYRSE